MRNVLAQVVSACLLLSISSAYALETSGTFVGPSSYSRIAALAQDKSAKDTMYCVPYEDFFTGSYQEVDRLYKGLHKSTDGGEHWSFLSNPWPTTHTVSIMYADGNHVSVFLANPLEAWNSVDGGNSWHKAQVPEVNNAVPYVYKPSPHDSDVALLGLATDNPTSVPTLMKTDDGGMNWRDASITSPRGDKAGPVRTIYFDKETTGRVLAGTFSFPLYSSQIADTLFESLDNGETWIPATSPFTRYFYSYEDGRWAYLGTPVLSISESPIEEHILYLLAGDPTRYSYSGQQCYMSNDYGRNWELVTPPEPFRGTCRGRARLFGSEESTTTVYAGGAEDIIGPAYSTEECISPLMRSQDGGVNWDSYGGLYCSYAHPGWPPYTGDSVVALYATEHGQLVSQSALSGISHFSSTFGYFVRLAKCLPVDRNASVYLSAINTLADIPEMWALTYDRGPVAFERNSRNDCGTSWSFQFPYWVALSTPYAHESMYALTEDKFLCLTGGFGIVSVVDLALDTVTTITMNGAFLTPFATPRQYLVGTDQTVSIIDDTGTSLTSWIPSGMPSDASLLDGANTGSGIFWLFAAGDAGVVVSHNAAESVEQIHSQVVQEPVSAVGMSESDSTTWYCVAGARPNRGGTLYGRTSSSDDWTTLSGAGRVEHMAVDPQNSSNIVVADSYIYLSSHGGIRYSTDGGLSWHSIVTGTQEQPIWVHEVELVEVNGRIHIIASTSSGLWTTYIASDGVSGISNWSEYFDIFQ